MSDPTIVFGPKRMTLEEVAAAFYAWGQTDPTPPVDKLTPEDAEAFRARCPEFGKGHTIGGVSVDAVRAGFHEVWSTS